MIEQTHLDQALRYLTEQVETAEARFQAALAAADAEETPRRLAALTGRAVILANAAMMRNTLYEAMGRPRWAGSGREKP